MKKISTLIAFAMMTIGAMAQGPQSIKVTFNGSDNTDWKVSSGGTATVADGKMDVTMAIQGNDKYRADLQHQTSGTYTMDKTKDIVWAVKLSKDIPGTSNSKKFEINYKDADGNGKWINGINNPSGNIATADGGKIYYFNLGADGFNKLADVQDGAVTINNIHFIFADATGAEEYTYSIDWVASFASVADLNENADMLDDSSDVLVKGDVFNVSSMKSYGDLASAISAANTGDVIEVYKDQVINSRLNVSKAVTLKAGNTGVSIKRDNGYNGIVILSSNADCDLVIDGIDLDGNNVACSSTFIEAGNNGKVTLKNLIVKNNANTTGSGETNTVAIISKGGGQFTAENVTFEDNTCSTAVLFNGNSVTLKGNIVFSGNSCNDIYSERHVTAASNDIEWTQPINIYFKNPEEDKVIVGGGAWSKGLEAFNVVNEGWYLYMKENSTNGDILLTQTKPTAIENIHSNTVTNLDAAYNIAGQRVKGNMKGIVIVKGKKAIMK